MPHERTPRVTLTSRAFRRLTRLLPTSFSARETDDLCAVYDALDADARVRHGWPGVMATFVSELPGLARLIASEYHVARVERRRRQAIASYQLPYSEDSSMIESLLQDIRYAARALGKSLPYTTIAVATLALGIGANTAIFSVVQGVLLAPLPFPQADRIVTVMSSDGTDEPGVYGSSPANFNDMRRDATSASHVAGFSTQLVTLIGERARQ